MEVRSCDEMKVLIERLTAGRPPMHTLYVILISVAPNNIISKRSKALLDCPTRKLKIEIHDMGLRRRQTTPRVTTCHTAA